MFAGLLLVAMATIAAAVRVGSAIERARREATLCHLLALFAPALQAVRDDPRQYLVWHPLAQASRRLFADAAGALDAAVGGPFPFAPAALNEAHAQWTAVWLTWERSHDGDYALRAAALEQELDRSGERATPLGRARMAALEREKLDRYQERYQQYITTARALQRLVEAGEA